MKGTTTSREAPPLPVEQRLGEQPPPQAEPASPAREECDLDLTVRGRGGCFRAHGLTISPHELEVELIDDLGPIRDASPRGVQAMVDRCFRTGATVRFVHANYPVRADVADAVRNGTGGKPRWVLLFRFRQPLGPETWRSLGFRDAEEDW